MNRLSPLFLLCTCLAVVGAEWQEAPGYRWHAVSPAPSARTGFTLLSGTQTGIRFTNVLNDRTSITNRNLLSGSGVALGDIDGDGRCDIYFAGLEAGGRLYRNLGDFRFEDITERSGVACPGQASTGAVLADVDGDGDLDLLVSSFGSGTRLFVNDAKGTFTEFTRPAGLASATGSTSMALADVDGDGDLDLYVSNFRPITVMDQPDTQFRIAVTNGRPEVILVNGRPVTEPDLANRFVVGPNGQVLELGEEDAFYHNDGRGRFSRVSFTGGKFLDDKGQPLREAPFDWGLAVQFHDVDQDGDPDLYVCNDLFTPDRFWLNDGQGGFRAVSPLALRNNSTFSMGVDFADLNRDGHLDFITVDMYSRSHLRRMTQIAEGGMRQTIPGLIEYRVQFPRNTLHMNRGDMTFAETAFRSGVEATEWSWGPIFLDVDLDGYEDLLVANGQLRDFQHGDMGMAVEGLKRGGKISFDDVLKVVSQFPGLFTPNVAFRNRGDGTFEDAGPAWGFDTAVISQGMALGDLDNDGDLDVVVNNLKAEAGVYRNDTSKTRVGVRLRGRGSNSQGVGARITLLGGAVPEQSQEILAGGRYLSGDQAMRVFAAREGQGEMTVRVRWRSGAVSEIQRVQGNRVLEILEPDSPPAASPTHISSSQGTPEAWFIPVHHLLQHSHHQQPFDDFARQPLLPRTLSQSGPGVAWMDVNSDGWDDAIIGSGRGGKLAVFLNLQTNAFSRMQAPLIQRSLGRDSAGMVSIGHALIAGSSNWEDGLTNGGAARVYDFSRGVSGEILVGVESVTGPVAAADVDGDGDLDLFIGGRTVAGRYPEAGVSKWYANQSGRFVLAQRLTSLGMVSAATFSDMDGDGDPDLVIACEWGPLRILYNNGGQLKEEDRGLGAFTGWWTSVGTGDFDEDGRPDIVAGNLGDNTEYRATSGRPWKIRFGDLRGAGSCDIVESYFDEAMGEEVPHRTLRHIGMAFPFVRDVAETFEAYGKSSLKTLYGERLASLATWEIRHVLSTVFLNRGDRFEARTLPGEIQWSPVMGLVVADLDGDGHEDIAVSQNVFGMAPDSWRRDAGRGAVLRGDGRGGFTPVANSGLRVYGEGRGLAVGDFDRDGRADLLAAQNGAETQLYRNSLARPGLRIQVLRDDGGVGTALRARAGGTWGPLREIKAGSGYGSQDSLTTLMSAPGKGSIDALAVRFPRGPWRTNQISAELREIQIRPDGSISGTGGRN